MHTREKQEISYRTVTIAMPHPSIKKSKAQNNGNVKVTPKKCPQAQATLQPTIPAGTWDTMPMGTSGHKSCKPMPMAFTKGEGKKYMWCEVDGNVSIIDLGGVFKRINGVKVFNVLIESCE